MKNKPDLSFWSLWNLSFGFFGVQIAYALQSANISRIFATLGADPHELSYFWLLPPLAGLIIQPIVALSATAPGVGSDGACLIWFSERCWQWSSCVCFPMPAVSISHWPAH